MSFLGVDVGTTGCKAALFTEDGTQLSSAYREYAPLYPQPGWVELEAGKVFELIKDAIREATAVAGGDPVKALSVSCMGEAITPVTDDRKIIGNCILSSDVRGGECADDLRQQLGQEAFYRTNPNILGVNYSLPKMLWIKKNDPELFAATDRFLLWSDLVGYMLGGEPVTDYSLANRTLLLDIRQQGWSEQILELCGMERDKLPSVMPAGSISGTVNRQMAEELGLTTDTAIVVGGHDQCCNALGAGICTAGRAVCGIGTYECITPVYDFVPDSEQMLSSGLNVEHHVVPGLYASFIYNQSGSLIRWFRDTFAAADVELLRPGQDIHVLLADEMPDEPTRLLLLPRFEMTGSPGFLPGGAGTISGLSLQSTRGEILKGLMECITLYFADCIDSLGTMGIDTSEFVVTGGGARSDKWLQIKADIFGVPFVRPAVTEAGILGAVILSAVASGCFNSHAEAAEQFVNMEKSFEPDAARHERYIEKLAEYREFARV